MAENPIAYEEQQDPQWAADVGKLEWQRSAQFPGLVLKGACPSCQHQGAIDVFVATAGTTYLKGKTPASPPKELVDCRCTFKHDGAPDKPRAGCGRWGYVPVVAPAGGA